MSGGERLNSGDVQRISKEFGITIHNAQSSIMKNLEKQISRAMIIWIFFICSIVGYMISIDNTEYFTDVPYSGSATSRAATLHPLNHMFQVGPNNKLFILGVCINTQSKYLIVVSFCFVNTGLRGLNNNIIHPWVLNVVQDEKNMVVVNRLTAYELTLISTIYTWFDFFMYMNILMAQIDLFFIEVFADLIITTITTRYYLNKPKQIDQMGTSNEAIGESNDYANL